ncbi:hypothetical protein [Salibacterium halotolerans]|uniref:hypothetical protein n=1 Tax=Salibacterium halotolerans TaxID=1884432 RepID=UPI00147D28B0|nr:hypothetical protein [Salibacterium halotolerans]
MRSVSHITIKQNPTEILHVPYHFFNDALQRPLVSVLVWRVFGLIRLVKGAGWPVTYHSDSIALDLARK